MPGPCPAATSLSTHGTRFRLSAPQSSAHPPHIITSPHTTLAVIGGGPAGLRAAEVAASAGIPTTLFDGKPSVGRKFLVAGKGGLNLTHGEPLDRFATRYSGPGQPPATWPGLLDSFSPADLRSWAAGLGTETFQASSGRVYPKALKAAPLLRAWVARLKQLGVRFEMKHQWSGLTPGKPHQLSFTNGRTATADAVIFALGGASWPGTGSDGSWLPRFQTLGIPCSPLQPANCGWECQWTPEILAAAEGKPIKNITVTAGAETATGELLVTRYGLEGGTIYQLGKALRAMDPPVITIDFKPTFSRDQLIRKMESVRRNFLAEARTRWKLGDAAHAILAQCEWSATADLATAVKNHPVPLTGPRPIAEAISSAGGVRWDALDAGLMLRAHPGVFIAGEMIDWEAPTGGYLMQGCFATGTRAARAATAHLAPAR